MQPNDKTDHHSDHDPPTPFPDFDPNYPLDKVDDNLKQLQWDDATPQPLSCKEKELPTTEHAQLRASDSKVGRKYIQSPADGYFEQRSHPQQTFVENDPTTKAKEAEIERSRNTASEPQTRASPPRSRWADREEPVLLDAGPAPPDYEAATADRRRQEEQSFRSDHPLVRNGLLGEHGVFSSRGQPQQPESMTQPQPPAAPLSSHAQEAPRYEEGRYRDDIEAEEQPTETQALLSRSRSEYDSPKKKQRSWFSRCMKSCCMLFGVLILIIVAIIATQATLKPHSDYDRGDSNNGRFGERPADNDPTPPHPLRSHGCSFDSFSRTRHYGYKKVKNEFEFRELIDSTSYRHLFPSGARITGTIKVAPALKAQEEKGNDVSVWVNVAASKPIYIKDLDFNLDMESLEVLFPDIDPGGADWGHGGREPCFDIAVAIHVRKGVKMGNWRISTAHLDVVVEDGVFGYEQTDTDFDVLASGLTIENSTEIFAVSGDVNVAYWSSRTTIIETSSGDIDGSFALRDLLVLSSKSGHIDANVSPKKADKEEPVPAEFIAKSFSGYVNTEFPTNRNADEQSAIPDRDYKVRVETKSGDISGTYILGQSAKFSAISGDLRLGVMPYSANLSKAELKTEVTSGTTKLELFEPYHADSFDNYQTQKHRDGIIDALHSHHKSTSGDMELKYPQEWEGKIDGETLSGDVRLRGKDVEVWMDSDVPGLKRRVIAHKGSGHSEVKFETLSGDVDLLLGEELVLSRRVLGEGFVG